MAVHLELMTSETEDYLRPERHRLVTPPFNIDHPIDRVDMEFSSPQEKDISIVNMEYKWLLETEFPLALQVFAYDNNICITPTLGKCFS